MNELNLAQAVDLSAVLDTSPEDKASQLPNPSGYRILCAIPEVEKEFESGIAKPDSLISSPMARSVKTTAMLSCLFRIKSFRIRMPSLLREMLVKCAYGSSKSKAPLPGI